MTLLVNHHLIPITIQPQSISNEQICYKRSQCIGLTALFSFFDVRKQGPKANFEKCYQCSASIENSMEFFQSLIFPSGVLKLTN